MAKVRVTLSREVDAAYIYLVDTIAPGAAVKQVPMDPQHGMIVLDFDTAGVLLGIEVLDASQLLPPELLAQAEQIDEPNQRPATSD